MRLLAQAEGWFKQLDLGGGGDVSESHYPAIHCSSLASRQRSSSFEQQHGLNGHSASCQSAAGLAPALLRRAEATAFLAPPGPVLGKPKVMLMYQSQEVYKTDVAKKLPGIPVYQYACKHPDEEGVGEKSPLHPSMVFNDTVKNLHIVMKDTTSGETFWDAKYVLPPNPLWGALSKSVLPSALPSVNGGKYHQPCVPTDDPKTHHFDISIQTQDNYHDDNTTPWGDEEGFENLRGPKAHIGFDVKRYPLLEEGSSDDPAAPQKEVVGQWRPGGNVSRGPVHDDRYERVLNGEENPFEDPVTGDPGTNYYHWIIDKDAKARNIYEFYDKYSPPPLMGFGWI